MAIGDQAHNVLMAATIRQLKDHVFDGRARQAVYTGLIGDYQAQFRGAAWDTITLSSLDDRFGEALRQLQQQPSQGAGVTT